MRWLVWSPQDERTILLFIINDLSETNAYQVPEQSPTPSHCWVQMEARRRVRA
jgi:hypothetical protein